MRATPTASSPAPACCARSPRPPTPRRCRRATASPAGNRIAGTQPASAFAELAWIAPWSVDGELGLEWRAQGRTAVNDLNSDFAGGHALFNLRYSHRWALDAEGTLELLARVDNLADRRVVGSVIVNDANGRYFEPAAGRSGLVSLRYQRRF